jgi:hypothetical protein
MLFAAVAHLDEGLGLETLLILKVEKFLICLVGTSRTPVSVTERELSLFLKTSARNKASRRCRLE